MSSEEEAGDTSKQIIDTFKVRRMAFKVADNTSVQWIQSGCTGPEGPVRGHGHHQTPCRKVRNGSGQTRVPGRA
ncbi:hypothetical protein BLOT_000297 [Blomia tropicalis]|nr:hypothetical protein BLOT_000297 [Blomia tropicalis]